MRVHGLLLDEKVGDARLYVRWLWTRQQLESADKKTIVETALCGAFGQREAALDAHVEPLDQPPESVISRVHAYGTKAEMLADKTAKALLDRRCYVRVVLSGAEAEPLSTPSQQLFVIFATSL